MTEGNCSLLTVVASGIAVCYVFEVRFRSQTMAKHLNISLVRRGSYLAVNIVKLEIES